MNFDVEQGQKRARRSEMPSHVDFFFWIENKMQQVVEWINTHKYFAKNINRAFPGLEEVRGNGSWVQSSYLKHFVSLCR